MKKRTKRRTRRSGNGAAQAQRRRPKPNRVRQSGDTPPPLGEWWKLTALARRVHVHPKTLARWMKGTPFLRKVRGTMFVELGQFQLWWEREGLTPPSETP
jgi:hypothetical protein